MSFLKTIGAGVRDWEMNSNPPVDSFGYRDLEGCDFRIYYKVVECKDSMNCRKCVFNIDPDKLCAYAPLCTADDRRDKKNVYFEIVDIKPTPQDELL